MTFSILLIDDHPLMSAALAGVLRDLRPRVTCRAAHTGAAALRLLAEHNDFGLIVLDLALPDTSGFELLARLRQLYADTPVMVVSASENAQDMRRAIAAGATGYVAKSASPTTLLKAADLVFRGDVYLPPVMHAAPVAVIAMDEKPVTELLSERQLDVLRLICAGKSNKFIGYELGLAEKTVKGRVTAIFKALGVESRTQAVLKASELDLFTPAAPLA
jgi:two-component system, NarL family, nitrate/nitrite response regulator NarL